MPRPRPSNRKREAYDGKRASDSEIRVCRLMRSCLELEDKLLEGGGSHSSK